MLTTTVCAALSAAGLAIALLTAYRRRFAAATRIAAFALVPIGLAMAGLISLAGKVGRAVGGWATDLVLDPEVWAGFGVLALAVVLYVIARVAAGRGSGRERQPSRRERRATARAERKGLGTASAPQASTGALGTASGATAGAQAAGRAAEPATASGEARGGRPAGGEDDFSDIEAILKKHGI